MSLTKTSNIDQITIDYDGVILLRTNNVIIDNGIQVSQSYSRSSLYPGQDLTGQPSNVVSIANITWTPEVISSYQAKISSEILNTTMPSIGA